MSYPLPGSYDGGWTSQYNAQGEFLQINLGNVSMVTGFATQGNDVSLWWVKTYTLEHGNEEGNFAAYNNGQASKQNQELT